MRCSRTKAIGHAVAKELGLPLIVKPAHEGSSIGLTKVTSIEKIEAAYELAAKCDSLVIAEEFIGGRELTAAFLDDRALPLIRIEAPQGNYDYQNKYFTDDMKYHCPSGLPAAQETRIAGDRACAPSHALGCARLGTRRSDAARRRPRIPARDEYRRRA